MIFPKVFKPKRIKVCDISESRMRFKDSKNKNLKFLLETAAHIFLSYGLATLNKSILRGFKSILIPLHPNL